MVDMIRGKNQVGKALAVVLLIVAGVGVGLAVGYAVRGGGDRAPASETPGAAPAEAPAQKTLWTCGMHPEIVEDHPGNCPKCGMKLTPMDPDRAAMILEARGEGAGATGGTATPARAGGPSIRIDPVTEQNMGLRVAEVSRGELSRTLRIVGSIVYDETTLGKVTTRADGWVEKVHVDRTGGQVHAGEPLFELYAPELLSAQEELVTARRDLESARSGGNRELTAMAERRERAAGERLRLFGIGEAQIEALAAGGRAHRTMTIASDLTGIVTEKSIVQGSALKAGDPAYTIADLSTVWVIGRIYESDLPFVQVGQEARMRLEYMPGRTWQGRVTYIYPYLEPGTREVPVRMEFHNPGYELKPGMYATIEIRAQAERDALLAPDMAVLRTGSRQVAFVALGDGRFEPRELRLGSQAEDGMVQVLDGLSEGERVVVSGQFLLDSEARLREATLKMMNPGASGHVHGAAAGLEVGHAHGAGAEAIGDEWTDRPRDVKFVCPMPEHTGVLYDEAGNCPLCGMKLVPAAPWQMAEEKNQPAGSAVADAATTATATTDAATTATAEHADHPTLYTCPMESHKHIVSDKPGKCPECEMTLVPTSEVAHGKESEAIWKRSH